ncbi:MAG: esterase [Deferribacteres bacterium]|nr:esterase [Deferribacteres bacterium]
MYAKNLFQLAVIFMFTNQAFSQIPTVSNGTIKHLENFSSQYVKARNVDVWLPPGYTTNKKYAVLYMHDGGSLFDSTITWNKQEWCVDETMTALRKDGVIQDCIVVGIYNGGPLRQSEYFPQKAFDQLTPEQKERFYAAEFYPGYKMLQGEIQSDNYLKFIVNELKPFVDSSFSVLTDRENTFVAGSSYGGLISIYTLCEYPEVFGSALCMSTHWPGMDKKNPDIPGVLTDYLQAHLPAPDSHRIYFDYGTAGVDSLYKPYQQQVDKIMVAKGYSEKNWLTKEFPGASHNERSWSFRLHIPFTFILGKKE